MSTGTTGAIRGGKAYVEVYLDDSALTQGLAKLQGKIKNWQASLSKLGAGAYGGELPEPFAAIARFVASPAGAFSALLGAAKLTADAREEMLRMSEATGVSVDKLSQYAYAARRAGISSEAFGAALQKMQGKEFMAAMQGMSGKGGGLKALTGATFAKLGNGDAIDRLREFIKLSENMPSEERIGLARRMGLSELLPLINQGLASLDAFTQRAKDLGLVMNSDDAKAAKRFELAFGDLREVLMGSVKTVGGALIPMMTGLANVLVNTAVTIRNWIQDHKALTQAIFIGTGVIVGAGIAIKGLSLVIGIASKVVTAFQFAIRGVSLAITAISTVLSWLPLLANPFVLAGIAVVALAGFLLYLLGAFDGLGKMFKSMAGDFGKAVDAISNAIASGNIEAAFKVVTAGLKLEWARLTAWMVERFDSVISDAAQKYWLISPALGALDDLNKLNRSNGKDEGLSKAEAEFNKAVAAAKALKPGMGLGGGEGANNAFAAAAANEHRGTFNGAIASLLGGESPGLVIAKADYQNSTRWRAEASQQHTETIQKLDEVKDTTQMLKDHLDGVE